VSRTNRHAENHHKKGHVMQLHEQHRPADWSAVVGQDRVVETIDRLRNRGLGGRAYWLSGPSGVGKTTIAKLIAAELADPLNIEELDAGELTPARLKDVERGMNFRAIGNKAGRAYIVNESHGLRRDTIRQLLVLLERLPQHVAVIFTSTVNGTESLFEDVDDAGPLMSRCIRLQLDANGLTMPFARRAREIAQAEGLDGQPIDRYVQLAQDCGCNLRQMLQRIEAGELIAGTAPAPTTSKPKPWR
jgi:replication-associated recombination protein RarA